MNEILTTQGMLNWKYEKLSITPPSFKVQHTPLQSTTQPSSK